MATVVKTTKLNHVQREQISDILKPYGFRLGGGSIEELEDGRKRLNVGVVTQGVGTFGSRLGKDLKLLMDVDEVYNEGVPLA